MSKDKKTGLYREIQDHILETHDAGFRFLSGKTKKEEEAVEKEQAKNEKR